MLIMFLRDAVLGGEGMEDMVLDRKLPGTRLYRLLTGHSAERAYRLLEGLVRMKAALAGNQNPKIAAQRLPALIRGK